MSRFVDTRDADGVEIKRGDEVWRTSYAAKESGSLIVESICDEGVYTDLRVDGKAILFYPSELTHEKPVFDANGERICKGDTVWGVTSGCKFEVIGIPDQYQYPTVDIRNVETGSTGGIDADKLTHREPDTLEKVLDDIDSFIDILHDKRVTNLKPLDEWRERIAALVELDGSDA